MVITTASTALSMMKMNQAARFAACGEGWVMPMVLIKAFAISWMNFMFVRCETGEIVAETGAQRGHRQLLNRMGLSRI